MKQAGRFGRVLAYCNSVAESKRFQMVLKELGLAAWHINGMTQWKERKRVMDEFTGVLQKPVHVLVTVEVLGEGINIPNADTCMFVEPRNSYRSIIQAIGRVLQHHPAKPLGHIILPAVAAPKRGPDQALAPGSSTEPGLKQTKNCKEQSLSQKAPVSCLVTELPGCPGGLGHSADILLLETRKDVRSQQKRGEYGESVTSLVMPMRRLGKVQRRWGMAGSGVGNFCTHHRNKSQTHNDKAMSRPRKAGPSTSNSQ